jgi:S1-C subfamily serine protease
VRPGRALVAVLAVLLAPALALAVPAPSAFRPEPRTVSALPSFVQRVAPALVALRVRAADPVGSRRFATAILFDARGYAVTVSYAVRGAGDITARLADGRTVSARVAGVDLDAGLAVVRLEGAGPWPAATFGDSAQVAAGMPSATVALDEDDQLVHAVGVVRGVRRFSAAWEYMLDRAFLVEPAVPSWAGAAIVDDAGRVVAVGSLRLGEPPRLTLAIPVETFVPVKDELIATGRVASRRPRPWLGLRTTAQPGGVFVEGFSDDGPARAAGFRVGDRIVAVDGAPVASQEEFYERLWRRRAGDAIAVTVERADARRTITVVSLDRQRLLPGVPLAP